MKLSELRDDQALDALEALIDPVCDIVNKETLEMVSQKKFRELFKVLLHDHRRSLVAILAAVECKKPEEFSFSLGDLFEKFKDLLEDTEFMKVFRSQLQTVARESSGAASADTEPQG